MYKLFWPDQPEFVRMAARFGATIVPFGVVGEDDLAEVRHSKTFFFRVNVIFSLNIFLLVLFIP